MALDDLSQDFLRVLLENNGDANTTMIRSETGMSRSQVTHRFRKLDDLDWIKITQDDDDGTNRTPPKRAHLTEEGKKAIRKGDAGKKVLGKEVSDENESIEVTREELENFKSEIDGVKNQLNVIVDRLNQSKQSTHLTESEDVEFNGKKQIKKLEREISSIRQTIEMLSKSVGNMKTDIKDEITNELNNKNNTTTSVNSVDNDLDEVITELQHNQDYLEEWMPIAEYYMTIMRLYVEDNMDDMEPYVEKAKEEINE